MAPAGSRSVVARRAKLLRRAAGWGWLAVWIVVLYAVAAPWRALGGLVDERLRWLEAFVLIAALLAGFTIGRKGREDALALGRTHLRLIRLVLYPVAALTAAALVVLALIGRRDPGGVLFTGFLSYWAGLDLAFGAVPLMEGTSYRLARPLDPEPEQPAGTAWVPPWERP